MDSGHNKKDTDGPTTRFSRTATRGGCPPESADVRRKIILKATNRIRIATAFLAASALTGCIREASNDELMRLAIQARMNTIATTVFYTGSDDTYDYFYLDKPMERDDACKVLRETTHVMDRIPVTRNKDKWRVYPSQQMVIFTNGTIISEGPSAVLLGPQKEP
jgi:hypothetical protein